MQHAKLVGIVLVIIIAGCVRQRLQVQQLPADELGLSTNLEYQVTVLERQLYSLTIKGVECQACLNTVTHLLGDVEGIADVAIVPNFAKNISIIECAWTKPGPIPVGAINDLLLLHGFTLTTAHGDFTMAFYCDDAHQQHCLVQQGAQDFLVSKALGSFDPINQQQWSSLSGAVLTMGATVWYNEVTQSYWLVPDASLAVSQLRQ